MDTTFARRLQYCLVLALVLPFAFDAAPAAADPRERRQASERAAGADRQGDASDGRVADRKGKRSDAPDDAPTRTERDDRPNGDGDGDRAVTDETARDERVGAADRKKNRPGKRNKAKRPNPPAAAPAPAPGAAPAPAPDADPGAGPGAGAGPASSAPAPGPNPGVGPGDLICQDEDLDDPDPPSAADNDASLDTCRADQIIVQVNPGASIGPVNGRNGTTTIASIPSRDLYLLQLPKAPSGGITHEAVYRKQLEDDPDTKQAYFNYTNQAPEGRPNRAYARGTPVDQGATPANGPAAPPAQLGVAAAGDCATGTTVTVAVVDTGIEKSHPAFAGMVFVGEANVLSDGGDVGDVGDGQDNDRDGLTDEMTGHGTHVAGIVAQVAPGANLMPIKALDSDGVGDTFLLAKAIYHAIDGGADVISLSLGTTADPEDTVVVQDAIKEAIEIRQLVVVAAAGNENRLEPQEYPATGGKAIGVASTNGVDDKSDFSNYHGDLDIGAPGTDIVSAFPGNAYVAWSGTSMATPWVSGTVALLLEENAGWDSDTIANRLRDTAAPINEPANAEYGGKLGKGRLDVAAAVGCR